MFVGIDANIWIKESLFRSPIGAAFLFVLREKNIKILFTEITLKEVIFELTKTVLEDFKNIEKNSEKIICIIGEKPNIKFPNKDEIITKIKKRFEELDEYLVKTQPLLGDYENAINRVINKICPNERKEQFRDSLLLELYLRESKEQEINFITADGDFFVSKKEEKRIPDELSKEITDKGLLFNVHNSIKEFLTYLGVNKLEFNEEAIVNGLKTAIIKSLKRNHEKLKNIKIDVVEKKQLDVYITEKVDKLSISFNIECKAKDIYLPKEDLITEGILIMAGSGFYDNQKHLFDNIFFDKIVIKTDFGHIFSEIYISGFGSMCDNQYIPFIMKKNIDDFNNL